MPAKKPADPSTPAAGADAGAADVCQTCCTHVAAFQATSTVDPTDTWVACTKCRDGGVRLKSRVTYEPLA